MPDRAGTIIHAIKVRLNILTAAVIVLCVLLLIVAGFVYLKAHVTENSLCALRSDLERRSVEGRKFVAQHPSGFAGISVKAIEITVTNQERTVQALGALSC